jgi:hypothetical protein
MQFETVGRAQLYYNQYKYSVSFGMQGSGLIRGCKNEDTITQNIRYYNSNCTISNWRSPISDAHLENVLTIFRLLNTDPGQHKLIICYDYVYIYTNNVALLDSIFQSQTAPRAVYSQVVVDRPNNVVLRKQSKYQYRTYFKSTSISIDASAQVKKFLLDRTDCYRFTPGLRYMLEHRQKMYFRDYYFVDHNDPGDILMLSLVCPGIVRKTMPIQTK